MQKRLGVSTRLLAANCCASMIVAGSPAGAQSTGSTGGRPYDLLPLLHVDRNSASDESFDSPVGGYTRFWIERMQSDSCDSKGQLDPPHHIARRYKEEARDPLSRLFWGRSHSRILQAKLVVSRSHAVTQTVTLAAASHDSSSKQGENWRSELGERRFLTPYFRVDQGSAAAIEVTLSASRETDSAITQNILSIIQSGARLAGPTGPLVTALNSDRLNQTSNFVDSAISRLFREKVVESSQSDFPAERWLLKFERKGNEFQRKSPCEGLGEAIASIKAYFPMGSHVWRENSERDVGEWRIYTTEPIVSIFSTVPLHGWRGVGGSDFSAYRRCSAGFSSPKVTQDRPPAPRKTGKGSKPKPKPNPAPPADELSAGLSGSDLQACMAFQGLVPARVFNLQVGEDVTLGQSLRGDAGIAAAVQRFQSDAPAGDATPIEICNLIAERADALGLNSWDAAAAVWAFAWNGGLNKTLSDKIWNSECLTAKLGKRLGLSDVASSAAPSPVPESTPPPPPTPGPAPQT